MPCLKSPATGAFPLSSILPTVVTQNLRKFLWPVSPCSCRSRRSRFMILKRSVRCNFHRETRENREQNGSVPSSPPCSYRSRCSRFMFLKRSVRCNPGDRALVSGTKGRGFESRQARFPPLWNFEESLLSFPSYHPRLYKICESSYALLLLVRTVRVVRGSWF